MMIMSAFRLLFCRKTLLFVVLFMCKDSAAGHIWDENTTIDDSFATTQFPDTGSVVDPRRPNQFIIHQGTISKNTYEVTHFVLNNCLTPVIIIIGFIGNCLSLAVFNHPSLQMKQTGLVYLRALSINDVLFLIISLYHQFLYYFVYFEPTLASKMKAYGAPYLKNCLQRWLGASSGLLIVVIAIERFIAMCFPLKISSSIFSRKPAIPISIAIISMGILMIPNTFRYKVITYYSPDYKAKMYREVEADWVANSHSMQIMYTVLNLSGVIIYRVLASAIILFCNITIIIQLYVSRTRREHLVGNTPVSSKVSAETQVSRMLLGVALVYLICITPMGLCFDILMRTNTDFKPLGRQHYLYFMMINLLGLSSKINSAANVFIYLMASANFRHSLRDVLSFGTKPLGKENQTLLSTVPIAT